MIAILALAVMACLSIFIIYTYREDFYDDIDAAHCELLAFFLALGATAGFAIRVVVESRKAAALPANAAAAPLQRAEVPDQRASLATRSQFCATLENMLAGNAKLALIKLEIDDFSRLRNVHGSAAVDAVLSAIAVRLRRLTPVDAALGILSGDQFGVLLRCDTAAQATEAGNRLLQGLSDTYILGNHVLDVSVSAGAALLPAHASTPDAALRAARLALGAAKSAAGHGWRLFEPRMEIAAEALQDLRTDLRGAIANGQIVPFYQPVVSLTTNRIVGFEVLARWQHPRRGLLPPDQFIPIAEQQRVCADLSLALVRQVSLDARAWPQDWTFAFNASPTQLRDLLHFMSNPSPLHSEMIDLRRIELEVTETVLIDDMALARAVVQAMHRGGAKVVLDDFGTGYANFFQLRELPFDRVKIDRTFVKDMMVSQRTNACVRAMLALASWLGATVIAEGVETAEAANHLRDMGCDFAQGYHYAPPVPASAVPGLRQHATA